MNRASANEPTKESGATRYRLAREQDGWWLVDAGGHRRLNKGVGVATQGESPRSYDPENPSYAAWRYYSNSLAWAEDTTRRLRGWGFDSAAGWADYSSLRQLTEPSISFTPVLHLGAAAGAPWWDMWDPRNLARMETSARDQMRAFHGDARVVGYFSDNELGWWNAALWKMTLEQPPSSGQRQQLVAMLQESYHHDWRHLTNDFEPENASTWEELGKGGMLYLKPGGHGIRQMRRFLAMMAARYYELMAGYIRRFDTGALFLGDRYPSFYYPEVAGAAGHWVDAISSNLNVPWRDGSFLRCYLEGLHRLSGKPVWVSEFYAASRENRSGNRNDFGSYPVLPTQADRAAVAGATLKRLFQLPYVVSADWFQYFDEPRHGRDDGENFNFGLVDIENRPYEELTEVFRSMDPEAIRRSPQTENTDVREGVPPAPSDPFAGFSSSGALLPWDRVGGYVPPVESTALADLYLAWKPEALYLGLASLEIIESAYYRSGSVPKVDRPLWIVHIKGHDTLRIRIGAGREPLGNPSDIRVVNRSGLGHDVSDVAALEIPARYFQPDPLKMGDLIELETELVTHARAGEVRWRGRYPLSDSRRQR